MSDFFNSGWSIFIIAIALGGIAFCVWLLLVASKRRVMAQDNTTGHVWDEDLQELNNPLPRWWMGLFVITVIFGLVYLYLYPGLGSNQGKLDWSAVNQLEKETAKANQQMAPLYAKFDGESPEQLMKDKEALGVGERLFLNTCAACHGSDARGSKGFPNLTDSDWLYGGDFDTIKTTITHGRQGQMPVMAPAVGGPEDVRNLANYVLSLSGSPHDSVRAQLGKPKFAVCAACHGAEGKGTQAMGAPNLTDKVWLHGWGEQAVVDMISKGKLNVMPAHEKKYTESQVRVLTAYVMSLSANQKEPASK